MKEDKNEDPLKREDEADQLRTCNSPLLRMILYDLDRLYEEQTEALM